jgi:3-hydroxyisobutyrate dehydrogenase
MNMDKRSIRVGFIGLGIMGQRMAGHILNAGHALNVYNRSRAKAEVLLARGAVWSDTPGDVAATSDVIITMVGTPHDVEQSNRCISARTVSSRGPATPSWST